MEELEDWTVEVFDLGNVYCLFGDLPGNRDQGAGYIVRHIMETLISKGRNEVFWNHGKWPHYSMFVRMEESLMDIQFILTGEVIIEGISNWPEENLPKEGSMDYCIVDLRTGGFITPILSHIVGDKFMLTSYKSIAAINVTALEEIQKGYKNGIRQQKRNPGLDKRPFWYKVPISFKDGPKHFFGD